MRLCKIGHKDYCKCWVCKAIRGETKGTKKPLMHKEDCICCMCKGKRKEPHKIDCTCGSCRNSRGDHPEHKPDCICSFCKAMRHELIGENNNFFGKKHSVDTRKKMSDIKLLSEIRGEKHPNWQGGKSFEPYPLGWSKTYKEQIRFRDNYTCQICGCSETECTRKLHVHHIDYNKMNINHENLISLCISCHMKTNYNRKYWVEYFTPKSIKELEKK